MPDGSPDDLFVEALQQMGAVTSAQLQAARAEQARQTALGKPAPLGDVLVRMGVTTSHTRESIENKLSTKNANGIRKLGPYRIVRKLGEGGMGAVYLAEDTQMGRLCAVKVLPKAPPGECNLLPRFHREAMAIGKLNHPNIVVAFTVGEEQGVHYFAMEYCTGLPLDKAIGRTGALPWQVAVDVVTQVARGLQHAHAYDIVHRDIKPANIFICKPPGSPSASASGDAFPKGFIAKILDLGLSKTISGTAESSYLTQTGMTLGTPHYIAPEQARGEREIDGRADIYSLGATFYELVTGETPFSGTTPAAVIIKHLCEPLRNPKEIKPDIPDAVVQVIQAMMAKEPADRYPSCKELLSDLEKLTAGMPPSSWTGAALKLSSASPSAASTTSLPGAHTAASRPVVSATPMAQATTVPATPPTFASKVDAATTSVAQAFGMDRRRLIAIVAAAFVGLVLLIWVFGSRSSTSTAETKRAAELRLQQERDRAQLSLTEAERAKNEAELRAKQAEKVAEEERRARVGQLEQQILSERRQAEEMKRQLEEARRLAEEAKRPTEPKTPPPDTTTKAEDGKPDPVKPPPATAPADPPLKKGDEPRVQDAETLAALNHWVMGVLEEQHPSEPVALPKIATLNDTEGLSRLNTQLARRALEAQNAERVATENEAALKNRIANLQRKTNSPERTQPLKPIFPPPNKPVYPPPQPGDRIQPVRETDTQQLTALNTQTREIHSQGEKMGRAYQIISKVKKAVTDRLTALGVQDVTPGTATPRRDVPSKIYVLKDGTEIKAYMVMNMGDQIGIKDEKGEMRSINASDVKEIRNAP